MSRIRLIGVPLDLGASRRGVDMGPSAVRVARLAPTLRELGHTVEDVGNIDVPERDAIPGIAGPLGFLGVITDVCAALADVSERAIVEGAIPLVLGGDHSIGAGSAAGVARAFRARGERIGCIWLDAHGDLNTPESTASGNVHGMPVAHLLGHGDPALVNLCGGGPALDPRHTVLVGIRDLDAPERRHAKAWGVTVFTMREIDERGLRAVMQDALTIAGTGTGGVHLSCDLDWVDPADAPGVGTPVRGGATYREAHLAMEIIADSGKLVSMDLVEVNPVLDDHNRTAELGVGLTASAFGLRIL